VSAGHDQHEPVLCERGFGRRFSLLPGAAWGSQATAARGWRRRAGRHLRWVSAGTSLSGQGGLRSAAFLFGCGSAASGLRLGRLRRKSSGWAASTPSGLARLGPEVVGVEGDDAPRHHAEENERAGWCGALSACEAKDERERVLGARPVFADEGFLAAPEEAAEDERDDDDVVELAGDGDEIGDEVEGEREVTVSAISRAFFRRGTRGSRSRRLQRTTQSGMKPASARALSCLPAMTSARTSAAYRRRQAPTARSDQAQRSIRSRLAAFVPRATRAAGQVRRSRGHVGGRRRQARGGLLGSKLSRQTKGQLTTMVVRLRVTSPALRACCSCSKERTRLRCAPAFQVTSTTAQRGG
jgi:hypothetical protein